MKFKPYLSAVICLSVSCSTIKMQERTPSSLKAISYEVVMNEAGDPIVQKNPGDKNYVDPALQDDVVTEDVLEAMRAKLQEISTITMEDIEPAQLALPDYDVANKALRSLMKDNMISYFDSLEGIKKEVVKTLSELLALKRLADEEYDPKGLVHQEYEIDVKKKIPTLNKKINDMYSQTIDTLFSLGGNAILPVSAIKKGVAKDTFKEKRSISLGEKLYGICSTSLCLKKLSSDLEQWHNFVRNFNNQVNFTEFDGKKSSWTKNGVNTSPLVAIALVDAAQDMLKMKLKKNKDYSIPGVIAKAGANVVKAPAGIAVLMLSAPVYLFEKTSKVIADVLSFHVMKIELALNELDAQSKEVVFKGLRQNIKDYAVGLNSAIYLAPGEDKSTIIRDTFFASLNKARVLSPGIMNFFSVKDLVNFETQKIMKFQDALNGLSIDRLVEIKQEVSEDKQWMVQVAIYESKPELLSTLSIREIIQVITTSPNASAFKAYIDSDPNLKKRILEQAPDLEKKLNIRSNRHSPIPVSTTESQINSNNVCDWFTGEDNGINERGWHRYEIIQGVHFSRKFYGNNGNSSSYACYSSLANSRDMDSAKRNSCACEWLDGDTTGEPSERGWHMFYTMKINNKKIKFSSRFYGNEGNSSSGQCKRELVMNNNICK